MYPENNLSEDIENEQINQERSELGTSPSQDAVNGRLRQIMPERMLEGNVQRGDIEKLARFFSELPQSDELSKYFFGFLSQIHQYGFFKESDTQVFLLQLDKAIYAYMNSVPSWEWKREHSIFLENIRTIFYSMIRSAIGTTENVQNARTALNELRISRHSGEYDRKKRGWFGG